MDTIITKAPYSFTFALLTWVVPALASVSPSVIVSSPTAGATVATLFVLDATTTPCSGQPVASTGYSLDDGATTIVNAISINAEVSASLGAHTLHVESWGNAGAGCGTDVSITVSAAAPPALFTNVTVSQPAASAELVSPFTLIASGTQCESQPIAAMGFSIDNSTATSVVYGVAVNAPVTSATGMHTLHVKSWGNQGAGCDTDVAIQVVPSPISTLPANAIAVQSIQTLANWQAAIDTTTGAAASTTGVSSLNATPSLSGASREFVTNFASVGGERFEVSFGVDTSATNFLYDTWVYIPSSSTDIANLEFDLNQVIANGDTVIFGFQCDFWSNTWDYAANAGTPLAPSDVWLHSTSPCNVLNWTKNAWHHVQITYSHDSQGNATYQSVWLDNVEQDLHVTVPNVFSLGWSPTLLTNFQVDSMTSQDATNIVYLDNLTVWRYIDYTAIAGTSATMNSPDGGSTFGGASQLFTWSTCVDATQYALRIGSTGPGSTNLYNGPYTTNLSATVNNLPHNGETVYVRLFSLVSGVWQHNDYTFTAFTGTAATLTGPTPGTRFSGPSQLLTWSSGVGVTQYVLRIGSTGVGSSNLYTGPYTTNTSATVSNLPLDGETVNVRLWSLTGGEWLYNDYTYTAFTGSPATLTYPNPGTLSGASQLFTWSNGVGVTQYALRIGSTGAGSTNLYYGPGTTNTSATVSNLPLNRETVNVRLWSLTGGEWLYNDYIYTGQ